MDACRFIHGVMNTDNMAICETIDYGPCAFMDSYNLDTCSIDHMEDMHMEISQLSLNGICQIC